MLNIEVHVVSSLSVNRFLLCHCCLRKNGKTVYVIDPDYKEMVQAKVVEVFGERSLESVYKMIEDVLEDEKMVRGCVKNYNTLYCI